MLLEYQPSIENIKVIVGSLSFQNYNLSAMELKTYKVKTIISRKPIPTTTPNLFSAIKDFIFCHINYHPVTL